MKIRIRFLGPAHTGHSRKLPVGKPALWFSCMTFRLRCTSPKVERVKASVRKMIRSGATMRKTQRRETHRACRRRPGLRNGVRRQAKRDLVYALCYFSHSCTCLASDQTTSKRGKNCYTTLRQNFSMSRAICLVHACNKKRATLHNNFTGTIFDVTYIYTRAIFFLCTIYYLLYHIIY